MRAGRITHSMYTSLVLPVVGQMVGHGGRAGNDWIFGVVVIGFGGTKKDDGVGLSR